MRVREGGPDGQVVGVEKIGIGNGIYTGDASWGTFGLAYSPGEVPLEPGKTYAIEIESIENYESLHGYVNIKGMVSDDKPGFNPYKKVAPDTYERAPPTRTARTTSASTWTCRSSSTGNEAKDWDKAVDSENLLANGDMEAGELDEQKPANGKPQGWKTFAAMPEPPIRTSPIRPRRRAGSCG